jgi:hypothetical protein
MGFEMVYSNERYSQSKRESFGKVQADEKRTDKAGSMRNGDASDVSQGHPCSLESLFHDWHNHLLVGTGCEFRNDSAIPLMHNLGRDNIREDGAIANDGGRGFIA